MATSYVESTLATLSANWLPFLPIISLVLRWIFVFSVKLLVASLKSSTTAVYILCSTSLIRMAT